MQKMFRVLIPGLLVILSACHSKNTKVASTANKEESPEIFPVTSFLKGQLRQTDSLPVTPLKTVTVNGHTDSSWLKRESIRQFAAPFIKPVIDSINMFPYFAGKSFLDQTINAVTLSYDPVIKLPDDLLLRHWDVYINPQDGTVERIYLVKEAIEDSGNVITQLTWKVSKWCSIRTIIQKPGKEPQIREEKMTWDFDN